MIRQRNLSSNGGSLASSYGKTPGRLSQAEHGEVGASSQQIPLDRRQ